MNLKEQGQLIRQDDFIVFFRKKKCVRRIFLFQDLILFSKTKKTDIGNDVYVYKQSFKVCTSFLLKGCRSINTPYDVMINLSLFVLAPTDERHRDDTQLKCEQFVF